MLLAATRRFTYLLLLTASFAAESQELKVPDAPERVHIAVPSDRFPASWYSRAGDGTEVAFAPTLDQPYSSTVETTTPLPSPTGEIQAFVSKGLQARDRLGRTRSDSENGGVTIEGQTFKTKAVIVGDPVSHCQFNWMQFTIDREMPPEMRVAFVTCGAQTVRYKELDLFGSIMDSSADGTSTHGDTTTKTEHLAPVQIDGLNVNRLHVSNSRFDEHGTVKEWSTESWYSPELREVVRMGDEQNGYMRLTGISRKDPDPNLFYPPEGYRIELQPVR